MKSANSWADDLRVASVARVRAIATTRAWWWSRDSGASAALRLIASPLAEAAQLDHAAGLVGVTRHERVELRLRLDHIEQAPGDALVERADRCLVLAHRVAVGAVAQADPETVSIGPLDRRLEPERGQRDLERVRGEVLLRRSQLVADLPTGLLHAAQPSRSRVQRAREPAAEILIRARGSPAGPGVGGDRPR